MNEEAIVQALETLASKLGVTAEYLWQVLVAQAHVEVVTIGLLWVVTFVLVCASTVAMKRVIDDGGFSEDPTLPGVAVIILFIATFGFAITAIDGAFQLPTLLLNPEYWALNEILDVIR